MKKFDFKTNNYYTIRYVKGLYDMTKLNEVTRTTARGVALSSTGSTTICNGDLIIGNKIAKVRKGDRLETMSIYKDLFIQSIQDGYYVSLTDANHFNRKIENLDKKDEVYFLTDRKALEYSLYPEERTRIANPERLCSFGFKEKGFDYERAIRLLKRMNKYLEHKVTANLVKYYGESLMQTKSGIVVFHEDNFASVNDSITKDLETGLELTKKYEK